MLTRELSRFVFTWVLAAFAGLTAVSCGTGGSTFSDAGAPDASMRFDGSNGFTDGSIFGSPDGSATGTRCIAKTCQDWGYSCGRNGDGCGGVIDCGSCTSPEFCGGGGYSQCGTQSSVTDSGADAATTCTPTTCEALGYDCGWATDGCGGVILCGRAVDGGATTLATAVDASVDPAAGGCAPPAFCGGGGPNVCGGNDGRALPDGAPATLPDGAPVTSCTPKSCADQGFECGAAADGCGNVLAAPCGACTAPAFCGGGGRNRCGAPGFGDSGSPPVCVPKTCADLGVNCGPQGDGCGHLLASCGSCAPPQFCGGGGPGVCGGSVFTGPDGAPVNLCAPKTCQSLGYTCGPAADQCGGLIPSCGTCGGTDTCGGGGTPGACGHACTGLCAFQATCDGGTTTTLTGTVLAAISKWSNPQAPTQIPFPPDPVPNVLVYVPNAPLTAIPQGYTAGQCPACAANVSGSPLVSTYTNFDGSFTLTNVPTPPGTNTQIPIVIQLGRWRKEFLVNTPPACKTTAIGSLHMPSSQTDGGLSTNIPLTAISTGNADALECVLLKMGIDQAEFTARTGTGRIQIYSVPGAPAQTSGPGASVAGSAPEATLMNGTNGTFMNYDQIMLPCWGRPVTKPADQLNALGQYADSGGHFFATHYSYTWLVNNPWNTAEFNKVATWNPDADNAGTVTWTLNVSTAPPIVQPPLNSGIFYKWLNYVCALSNVPAAACKLGMTPPVYNTNAPPARPQVAIHEPRYDVSATATTSVDWIDGTDQGKHAGQPLVEHFTFNTPVGAASSCGHAIFSDFHVTDSQTSGTTFPAECGAPSGLTAQERVLEYMIFDLASCVSPPASTCTPLSCAQQGLQCGPAGDGCGNQIAGGCGACPSGLTCGGGGTPGVCGAPDAGTCVPLSCAAQHLTCGPAGDGCGNLIAGGCGTCPPGQTCGGGGTPGICGAPDAGMCMPLTCAAQNIACGPAGDGCGNLIAGGCGSCPPGQSCGGGGTPGQCGSIDGGACIPNTCAAQNIACGPAGDGCGNLIAGGCGTCPPGQTCGGGGMPGQCGGSCVPLTCAALGFNCGPAGDGCGALLDCGQCSGSDNCGGAGQPGICGHTGPR